MGTEGRRQTGGKETAARGDGLRSGSGKLSRLTSCVARKVVTRRGRQRETWNVGGDSEQRLQLMGIVVAWEGDNRYSKLCN